MREWNIVVGQLAADRVPEMPGQPADAAGPTNTISADEIQRLTSTLESIAGKFPKNSDEFRALRVAAEVYLFFMLHNSLRTAYQAYRSKAGKPLTKAQKADLKSMGIDPD